MSDTRTGARKEHFVLMVAVSVVTAQSEKSLTRHVKIYQTVKSLSWFRCLRVYANSLCPGRREHGAG